jgi:hypothetical protein
MPSDRRPRAFSAGTHAGQFRGLTEDGGRCRWSRAAWSPVGRPGSVTTASGMLGRVSRLYRTDLTLPVAPLGDENPLPLLRVPREMHELTNFDELPAELAAGIRYGALRSLLPCLLQDG